MSKMDKEGATKSSSTNLFIPNPINTFRNKPIISTNNTAMFFFKNIQDKEIWLLIEKTHDSYYYQWIQDPGDEFKRLSAELPSTAPLYRVNQKRDKILKDSLTIEIPENEISSFLIELGLFIQDREDLIFRHDPERLQDETNENIYQCFEDYPEQIKREALKIVNDNPLKFFEDIISLTHKGDTKVKNLILLSVASLFVKNAKPVHQGFKGSTGVGKTSVTKKTLKIVPERYIQEIRDSSPKYIYYAANTFNPDYNIFLFDDIVLNETITELLKTLTDNEAPKKVLKTVIEQKAQDLEIPGNTLGFCTVAKDILNNELDRRLMYNNPKEDTNHTNEVKEMIKTNSKIGLDVNNDKISQLYLIANAVFEKLIETPIKVYNPYLEFIDLEDKNYTDIEHFINLVKARSFYFQHKRYKINDIIIGNLEDLESVNELWSSISAMQLYKIDAKQIELLKKLPLYNNKLHETLKESWELDKTDFYNAKTYTYKYIAKELNLAKTTVEKWVRGRKDSDKMGLEELGLVKPMKLDPENRGSPVILYFNEDKKKVYNALNSNLGYIQVHTKDCKYSFGSLNKKKSLIIEYLLLHTIYDIRGNDIHISHFLNDNQNTLKSDKDIYNFLKLALDYLKIHGVQKKDDYNVSYENLIYNISSLYVDPVCTTENTQLSTQNDKSTKKKVLTDKSKYTYVPANVKEGLTEDILEESFNTLKLDINGLDKYEFEDRLRIALNESEDFIIKGYVLKLLDENFIRMDGLLILPTDKLLSLFED